MNKTFTQRFEPYVILIILATLVLLVYFSPILGIFYIPVISVFLNYLKEKFGSLASIGFMSYFILLMMLSKEYIFVPVPVISILLIGFLISYAKRLKLDFEKIFSITSFIGALSILTTAGISLRVNGSSLTKVADYIISWYKNSLDLQVKLGAISEFDRDSIMGVIKTLDSITVATMLFSLSIIVGFIFGLIVIKLSKSFLDNEVMKATPHVSEYKEKIPRVVALIVMMLVGLYFKNKGEPIGNIVFTIGETTFGVLSILVTYSLIRYQIKRIKVKRMTIPLSILILLLISPVSEIIMIFDTVMDFRNLTGKSLYHYLIKKIFKKGER